MVAAGAAQRAADYMLDRQPIGVAGDRAPELDRDRERVGAQREGDSREPVEALRPPTTELEEPQALAEAHRAPEESR